LLNARDWQTLAGAPDLAAALAHLGTTAYGPALDAAAAQSDSLPSLRTIEHVCSSDLANDMANIGRFVHGAAFDLLSALTERFELLNVKKVLRRLSQPERREHHLTLNSYDCSLFALVPPQQWDECKTPADVGRVLSHTYFAEPFRLGLASFGESHDLLRFEGGLEKAYYDTLLARVEALVDVQPGLVHRIVNLYFDEQCFNVIARLRFSYGWEGSAILPLLPWRGCTHLTERRFWELAALRSEAELVAALYALVGWPPPAEASMQTLTLRLRQARLAACRRAFLRASPLSVAPMVAFFFMKSQELADLISILQTKRFSMPVDLAQFARAAQVLAA
jgi:vacuolar-type H+-ATPase subunit C/Vma6